MKSYHCPSLNVMNLFPNGLMLETIIEYTLYCWFSNLFLEYPIHSQKRFMPHIPQFARLINHKKDPS